MKTVLIIGIVFLYSIQGKAQKIDSIFFNLYTDSLKKGTYNYINVDAKYTDGKYLPLTAKEITFTSSAGKFQGNSLFIDSNTREEKIRIKAVLTNNPQVWKEITIYIKKHEKAEKLKTLEEILDDTKRSASEKGRKKSNTD